MTMNCFAKVALLGLATASLVGLQTAQAQEHEHEHAGGRVEARGHGPVRGDMHGQVFDGRYGHGHYYPAFGASFHDLPGGYRPYFFRGNPFYFFEGVWYAPGPGGFMVVRPPIGLSIAILPPFSSTVWVGGLPYYYADNIYYTWDAGQNGYVVVDPPEGADQPSAAPPSAVAQSDLIIYPKNGQSSDQQAADRYECHSWAKGQTGFDPTQLGGGADPGGQGSARNNYTRAMSACLQARGYQVN
jgi:hypothetical protein